MDCVNRRLYEMMHLCFDEIIQSSSFSHRKEYQISKVNHRHRQLQGITVSLQLNTCTYPTLYVSVLSPRMHVGQEIAWPSSLAWYKVAFESPLFHELVYAYFDTL